MSKRFNTPPGWPEPPAGWLPAEDFVPDPSWPPIPQGWPLVVDDPSAGRSVISKAAENIVSPHKAYDPDTLWEAQSQTLTSTATGGHVVKGRYRLTHEFLYFERGTLRTDAQQVPIVQVVDVDVRQSMTQKARGVGDVIVHIERTTGVEKVTMESIPRCRDAQALINRVAREARHALQQRQNTMRYEHTGNPGVVPPGVPPPPAATGGHTPASDPMAQLRQLGELRDAGILTDAEFDAKKAEILGRI